MELEHVHIVSIDNVAAFDDMEAFFALIRKADAAAHFAAPNFIFNGDGGIVGGDWRVDGSVAPMLLSLASAERAQRAHAAFDAAVQRMLELANNKHERALIESAINVPNADDLLLVKDTLVLTNWGLVPSHIVTGKERTDHRREVVGMDAIQLESVRDSGSSNLVGQPSVDYDSDQSASSETMNRRVPASVWPIAVGAALLAILLIPGVLLYENDANARQSFEPLLQSTKENNEQLTTVLEERERSINEFQCPVASLGQNNGMQTNANIASMSRRDLRQYVDQATVLIMVDGDEPGIGTGFFISPTELLTNAHVVGDESKVKITSAALGNTLEADVVYKANDDAQGYDFALLSLPQPASIQPLTLTNSLEAGDEVFAAGFPGSMVGIEMQAQKNAGVGNSASMHFTSGTVSALAASGLQTAFISHTSTIMGGNSGGPLLNRCGNVVGVNTSVAADKRVYTAFGIALPVKRAQDFLNTTGSVVQATEAVCLTGS